jgi:hypothetical protein
MGTRSRSPGSKPTFPKTPRTTTKVTAKKKGYAPDALKLKVT